MSQEFPLALSAEFRSTDFGQKAGYYLDRLLGYLNCFPLGIGKTVALLNFASEATGEKTIREWEQGGILLPPLERGKLTLPSVMIAKLTTMRIFEANQQGRNPTYREIYGQIQGDLRESPFLDSLGQLNDQLGSKKPTLNLEKDFLFDDNGQWWFDSAIIRPAVRHSVAP